MEIKFKRNTKNKEEKNNRPSKVILVILALIFILAGVNLLKTTFDGTSLKPFGFIERIAAVGQANLETITGANATTSIKNEIKDNTDRCIPINPKTGSAMSSGTSMYVGKGGLNQGTLVGGGGEEVAFIQGESDKNKTNLDMGYILRIALGPQDVGSTVNFIKDANENGLTPVVRLCYSPEAGSNCSFDMTVGNDASNSVAKFYRDIYNSIGAGYSAVFVTGPNEPGTASEMTNFRLRNWDYATLVARTNVIASSLQDLRGSGITLAPAIFNTSNDIGGRYPTGGDFEAYNANGLDWSLFDNILINIYDTKNNNSFEEYKSTGVQSFAGENGLKVIVTEFGLFDKNEPGVKDKFINNFKSLCSETNVDGILFYRSIEELGRLDGPNADTLPVSDIAAMTKACVKLREWLNCNFDSAIYPDNPNKISLVADNLASSNPSCVVRDQTNSRGAALLVKCEGEGCSAKMVKTVKATLPVKFTGSNSSFGTKTKQYYPISAEVAALTDTSEYDPLNQFAGEIAGSDGSRYAMPLLGSAINNSYELAKYMGDFASVPNLQSFPSPGSFTSNLKDEVVTEIQRNIGGAISNPKSISVQQNGVSFIPDERVVSVNGNNFDKTDINTIKSLREYDPYLATTFSGVPNSCTGNMKYLENPDDYIPGPEVIVEEKDVWSGSGGELCRLYGERNNGSPEVDLQTSSNLNCSVNPTRRVPIAGGTALVNCRSVVFCNFAGGRCNINQAYSSCIDYTSKETDQVYIYSKDYGTIPSYQIKDIWDALYSQYTMLQNALKNRGLKMVFQENIGWKAEYTSKIRDGNKTVANAEQNLYASSPDELTFSQGSISGSAFEPKLFNNKYLTANGQSTINSQQYYDWLGYLDIIQEMRMVYLNSVPLGAEERIDNPYYQKSGAPNSEKEKINLAGQASLISSFPFLTCDQVELCKNKDRLISDFGEEKANKLCPFTKLDTKAQLTCVTDESDDRFEDGLEKQLCLRGYLKGSSSCSSYQCLPGESPDAGNSTAPDSIKVNGGIVSLSLDLNKYDFVASNPNDSVKSVTTFANENSVDFAVNTNFFSFGTEDPTAPEGLVAGKGTVEFNPTRRGIEAAVVFHNGDPTGGNSNVRVLSKTDKLALIEVSGDWGGDAATKIAAVRNSITIAVSGLPILISNGVRADTSVNYQGISNNFSPRTIVGWNAQGELVMAVLKSADFQGMVDAASQLGMTNAVGMDGGGSSQLYSRNGFPDSVDSTNIKVDGTVYWPGRENENGPRNVISYLGARSKNGSSEFNSSATLATSQSSESNQGEPLNITLNYPTTLTEVGPEKGYGCQVTRGSEDNKQCHTGLDYSLPIGTPVWAAAAGRVLYAGNDPEGGAYGISIRIGHPGGASTLYAHLSAVNVSEGQEVNQGQVIGFVGSTGNSTGPHLHFELRRNNTCLWDGYPTTIGNCTVDPTPYLTGIRPGGNEVPRCITEGDFSTPAIPGVLNCTIDIKNTDNNVDWAGSTDYLNVYIKSYNLDDNQSFTWIGSREMTSDAHPQSRDDRIRVTDFVVQRSRELGLSPKFVINLWLEETGGSAVGKKALGCGVYIDSYSSIPYRQGADAMISHMNEQLECLAGVVNKTSNFVEFMCTYSGETPAPGTSMKPGSVRTCNQFTNNANFPTNICKIYAQL